MTSEDILKKVIRGLKRDDYILVFDNLRILVGETQTSNYRETRNTLV